MMAVKISVGRVAGAVYVLVWSDCTNVTRVAEVAVPGVAAVGSVVEVHGDGGVGNPAGSRCS